MNRKPQVAIVDYGSGNLRSVYQAVLEASQRDPLLKSVKIEVTQSLKVIQNASHVVLPGQGHMQDCMQNLKTSGLLDGILEAHAAKKPMLGICVGMQMLLDWSEEGQTSGLGIIPGKVFKFQAEHANERIKIPQMGWNRVFYASDQNQTPHPLWNKIDSGSFFYFVHSFYAQPENPSHIAAETEHGIRFCSALKHDHWFATQFHPEKSSDQGLQLFQNFLNWKP